jgi:hypothetical protein
MEGAIMTDNERYQAACHAMQSGVAMKMNFNGKETEPKHLRVGINASMSDSAALVYLLISKGVFTLEEYQKAIADQMEAEVDSYQKEINSHLGAGSKVTLR